MPLPNNPYPNKVDLVYAVSLEVVNNIRQRLKLLKLSKPNLKEILQSTQTEAVSNERQEFPL